MSMVYCRGCAKEIHESAQSCPQCGAPSLPLVVEKPATYHWAAITSFVTGLVAIATAFSEPDGQWSSDDILGGMIIGAIPIAFSLFSFSKPEIKPRWMPITGLILGIFVICLSLGSK